MKAKKVLSVLLVITLIVSICGCGANNSADTKPVQTADQSITVTDMIGREVNIVPGSYKKVVCIGAGALRMYSYICDTSLLSGVEDIDNESLNDRPKMFDAVARPYMLKNKDQFSTLPSCGVGGPNGQTAEAEKILSCQPDIVISEYEDVEKEDALQDQLGVPVITLRTGFNGVFADEFDQSLRLLGQVFSNEEKAEKLISFVDDEANEISKRTADIPDNSKPNVYICGLGNWGTTNHLMTVEAYKPFEIAHIHNVVSGLNGKGVQELEEEKFVAIGDNMDIMFFDAAAVKNIKPLYEEDPTLLDTCKAWQKDEAYLLMAYNAYYTNYEISLMNTWYMAKTVYPDLFSDIDMTQKTNEITNAFLGTDLANDIFSCPQSFGGYQKINTNDFFR